MDDAFHVYDTTLRDGAQREGLSLSVSDKLTIARHLDGLGVGFIEGGWPGAIPTDTEFFKVAQTELALQNAQLAAFGATRKPGLVAADDPQVAALRDSMAPVVTLVAKSDVEHVRRALRTTPEENLAMVRDTVVHLREEGRRVFLDAEHFFDGYRRDPGYAVEVLSVAYEAGADVVVLCDTNGGMLPSELVDVVGAVLHRDLRVGIHAHNDAACAVANSMAAIDVGATHVQGTANGYGERCGNADLFPIIANLELKRGRKVLPSGRLADLQRVSHAVAEVANIAPDSHQPYVGASAFAHKGGLHASAVKVDADLYQHIDPAVVGNERRMLVSKQGGRASLELWAAARGVDVSSEREAVGRVVDRVKSLEDEGWSFEAAEASLELLLREELEGHREVFFEVLSWRVIVERLVDGEVISEATVKLRVDGERVLAVGEGNGPVNALDRALRSALLSSFPDLAQMELVDYKVRIVEGALGTGAVTRVLVETSDGLGEWDTVGVHENVIAASWHALVDSLAYGLLRQKGRV